MQDIIRAAILFFSVQILACNIPQTFRPLRLYDTGNGKIVEVFLQKSSPNSARLVSAQIQDERFEGEIIFYGINSGYATPRSSVQDLSMSDNSPATADFAEMYGFGKDSKARPAGTAMLVGSSGTTIEIVLYQISSDLQFGDGVAKDNKGRRYRVFLSVENK
jgi:hypothetical protein